jgi:alginate O-acetyltransferase complex protein AlgI
MPFDSILFLFVFLPLVMLVFYICPKGNWRNVVIILTSIGFFAWTDLKHLPLLIILVLFNYSYGLLISRFVKNNGASHARIHMGIAVAVNLLVLFYYKYLGVFIGDMQTITHLKIQWSEQSLPLGISYFSFSAISYLVDIYKGEQAERNLFRFSAFLVMFPKLMQGPITRFGQVKNELRTSNILLSDVLLGVRRFIIGFAKKVVLADSLAVASSKVFNADPSRVGAGVAWFGLIAFTLQIYFDFSGYTDMALGLGRMFGFNLPENFNYPYISRSIADFWRRWHMSLTNWIRTYIFLPLEYARRRENFFRLQSNILLIFLVIGLWHGATWNYIIWGLYFGLILVLEAGAFGNLLKKAHPILQHAYVIFLVMMGFVFFRLENIRDWGNFFKILFGGNGWSGQITLRTLNILFYFPIIILACLLSTPLVTRVADNLAGKSGFGRVLLDVLILALFILSVSYLLSYGYQPFLYGKF